MSKTKLPAIKEKDFQRQVIKLANLFGWRVAHFRPALTQTGRWVTAVEADGKGFPDLVMLRGDRLLVAELKVGKNTLTFAQAEWVAAFQAAGVECYVWYPRHWKEIEVLLR